MKPKTQEYVQFIKENHKDWLGEMNGAAVAKALGISQGRVSQLIKAMGPESVAVEFSVTDNRVEAARDGRGEDCCTP